MTSYLFSKLNYTLVPYTPYTFQIYSLIFSPTISPTHQHPNQKPPRAPRTAAAAQTHRPPHLSLDPITYHMKLPPSTVGDERKRGVEHGELLRPTTEKHQREVSGVFNRRRDG
ncbi:hypothetical protein RND81_14G065600 [Saponaria officinalis]|uniref:Uncharacterized protein n=1 Tax=Saponaria officinalis TaxID=3572 RepID=A0AAW1GR20_SAPOF